MTGQGESPPHSYKSAPHALHPGKTKYRDEEPHNLMNDPRVIRGSTFALSRQISLNKSGANGSSTNKNEKSLLPTRDCISVDMR